MPLQHSKSLADHELNLAKNPQIAWEIGQSNGKQCHPAVQNVLDHPIQFYGIIEQFGIFSNRNAFLKRETSAEEKKVYGRKWMGVLDIGD
jgi:uncharacterized protein (DUF924 family)